VADERGVAGQRPKHSAVIHIVGQLAEHKVVAYLPADDDNLYRNCLFVGGGEYPIEARGEVAERLAGELPGITIKATGALKIFVWTTAGQVKRRDVQIEITEYEVIE